MVSPEEYHQIWIKFAWPFRINENADKHTVEEAGLPALIQMCQFSYIVTKNENCLRLYLN